MRKISSQDASALLKQAGAAIRTLVKERDDALNKLSQRERDERVVKIAREMEEKGLNHEMSLPEKVAHLRKVPNLDVTEEAVKLAAPQGNFLGNPSEEEPGSGGGSAFEHFIVTGEDPR